MSSGEPLSRVVRGPPLESLLRRAPERASRTCFSRSARAPAAQVMLFRRRREIDPAVVVAKTKPPRGSKRASVDAIYGRASAAPSHADAEERLSMQLDLRGSNTQLRHLTLLFTPYEPKFSAGSHTGACVPRRLPPPKSLGERARDGVRTRVRRRRETSASGQRPSTGETFY